MNLYHFEVGIPTFSQLALLSLIYGRKPRQLTSSSLTSGGFSLLNIDIPNAIIPAIIRKCMDSAVGAIHTVVMHSPGTPTRRELVRPISVLHVKKIPPFSLTFTLKRPLFLRKR